MIPGMRTLRILLHTPLIPIPTGPAPVELSTFSTTTSSGPSRPRAASRTISGISLRNGQQPFGMIGMEGARGYASDHGKKELYSDEGGSTGAGTDDVAHTDAAFDKNPDPKSATKGVEQETGKDFTKRSPSNADYSKDPAKQGGKGEKPLNTSNSEAAKE